jgi:hypothetical protein
MCSKNSKSKNTYTFLHFNTQMSFYIITVLNLSSWSKQNYRFDYNVTLDAKQFEFLSCDMSYLASKLILSFKNCVKNVV